jgi:hypothetical protein
MFEFLFLRFVNVAGPPLGLPARSRQMIQPAIENKYRLNMQVSARAMGSSDCSFRDRATVRRARLSGYSTGELRWPARIAGCDPRPRRAAAALKSPSQIRDLTV